MRTLAIELLGAALFMLAIGTTYDVLLSPTLFSVACKALSGICIVAAVTIIARRLD